MTYLVNELFRSVQGEGVRTGVPHVFLRFAKCNMACDLLPGPLSPGGFACDTEFESGRRMRLSEIVVEAEHLRAGAEWICLTGGEPGLQVDRGLIDGLHDAGWLLAIETNGTVALPEGIDWITVSPKVAEHAIRQCTADEVKYVRGYGQAIPRTVVVADHYLISPAFSGLDLDPRCLAWCWGLVEAHPSWRLTIQAHKLAGVR